jgi:hypothetical protein
MISTVTSDAPLRFVAVSSPGGSARHFRVQFRDTRTSVWRLAGSFQQPRDAQASLAQLQQDGYEARVIAFNICPATM